SINVTANFSSRHDPEPDSIPRRAGGVLLSRFPAPRNRANLFQFTHPPVNRANLYHSQYFQKNLPQSPQSLIPHPPQLPTPAARPLRRDQPVAPRHLPPPRRRSYVREPRRPPPRHHPGSQPPLHRSRHPLRRLHRYLPRPLAPLPSAGHDLRNPPLHAPHPGA